MVEIKGVKTSHFMERKTTPVACLDAGLMGHVERPQSEPSNHDSGDAYLVVSFLFARTAENSGQETDSRTRDGPANTFSGGKERLSSKSPMD